MIQTTLVPGVPWPTTMPKKKLGTGTKAKILKCVTDNPGITSDGVVEKTGVSINYTREILHRLVLGKKITKVYEGRSVITYWGCQ